MDGYRTEGGDQNNVGIPLITASGYSDQCLPLQISDLAAGIFDVAASRTVACSNIWISDQRGERDTMSTNLKLLAPIDLGVLAMPFVGKEKEHPFWESSSQYCSSGN